MMIKGRAIGAPFVVKRGYSRVIDQQNDFEVGGFMRVFITGVAGFIGSTLAHLLLDQGHQVAGIDSLNDYYDPTLKAARLDRLMARDGFAFTEGKIETPGLLADLFSTGYDAVVHLAAQAGCGIPSTIRVPILRRI